MAACALAFAAAAVPAPQPKPASVAAPVIAILRGLTDPIVKVSMGSTAEIVAKRFGILAGAPDHHDKIVRVADDLEPSVATITAKKTVKPKATQEQRRDLIAKLPGLLTALNFAIGRVYRVSNGGSSKAAVITRTRPNGPSSTASSSRSGRAGGDPAPCWSTPVWPTTSRARSIAKCRRVFPCRFRRRRRSGRR